MLIQSPLPVNHKEKMQEVSLKKLHMNGVGGGACCFEVLCLRSRRGKESCKQSGSEAVCVRKNATKNASS